MTSIFTSPTCQRACLPTTDTHGYKQNKTKQNKTKQNKTKQNKTKPAKNDIKKKNLQYV
jgi:hypothetical protein